MSTRKPFYTESPCLFSPHHIPWDMEHEAILQKLELLTLRDLPPGLTQSDAQKLLEYVKNLERCLADALGFAHEANSRVRNPRPTPDC